MVTQPAIKSDSDLMIREMKVRPVYTEAEIAATRQQDLNTLEKSRHGNRPVKDMDDVIYLLEENARVMNDVMQDKDVNGQYDSYLQAAFDDTMGILDYLKELRNPT